MSYYTSYVLTIKNLDQLNPVTELKVARALASLPYYNYREDQLKELEKSPYPIDEVVGWDTHTWHNHQEDMKKIAAQFPECIFELDGVGEDFDDFWKEYYYGDKFRYCRGYRHYDLEPEWVK